MYNIGTATSGIEELVVMLRDNTGTNTYTGKLKDPTNPDSTFWTDAYRAQVPDYDQVLGGDSGYINSEDGVFMMTAREFYVYFDSIQVALDMGDQYKEYWYDKDGDN